VPSCYFLEINDRSHSVISSLR